MKKGWMIVRSDTRSVQKELLEKGYRWIDGQTNVLKERRPIIFAYEEGTMTYSEGRRITELVNKFKLVNHVRDIPDFKRGEYEFNSDTKELTIDGVVYSEDTVRRNLGKGE
jgi:hypothetical protein